MAIQKRKWKNGRTTYRVQVYHRGKVVADATFDFRRDAQLFESEVKTKLQRGDFVDTRLAERMLFGEALDRYAEDIVPRKKGARQEMSRVRTLSRSSLARLPLAKIRTPDIIKYRDRRLKEVGPNSVRLELAVISHLFTVASRDWGMNYLSNPVARGVMPSVKQTARDRRLQPGEEDQLMQACKEYGGVIGDIVMFALETAMRRAEIASLRWEDIHGNIARLHDTKNGERRDVPLSSRAREIIHRRAKGRSLNDKRVFGIAPNGISQAFSRVCKHAGIVDLRFHDLRHEATSRLFERGLNPMQVASITGHKTLQMLKRYTHLRAEDLVALLD